MRDQLKNKKKIILVSELEQKFSFIKDLALRRNIAITFQYILFLSTLDELDVEGTDIASSIHKDMIVYTAVILEGILHYCLKSYLVKNKEKYSEIMKGDWQFKDCKELYKISADEQICGVVRYKKVEPLTDQTNFLIINRACKKAGILSHELFDKAELLRKWRNKIHLGALAVTEDGYTKAHSQEAFDIARVIIPVVEAQLVV